MMEHALMTSLAELNIAILICSHQPSAIAHASRLMVLLDGQLLEHTGHPANNREGNEHG
jgi:ABC-type multidrug transport system fused ATPase/permease subunit